MKQAVAIRPYAPSAPLQDIHQEIYLTRPIAVIDIGSNSVRMVIYRWRNGKPTVELNEKKLCELGSHLDIVEKSNRPFRLPVRGKKMALGELTLFAKKIKQLEVPSANVVVMATAAVRMADDGQDFVAAITRRFGWRVTVLNATTEGVLAAYGVRLGLPRASGLVVDMGGGSMQITNLNKLDNKPEVAALPLGALAVYNSLKARGQQDTGMLIDRYLTQVPWLPKRKHKHIVLVGGTSRKIGKLYLKSSRKTAKTKLHGYALPPARFIKFLKKMAAVSPQTMARKVPKRGKAIPGVALTLLRLIRTTDADRVIFSKFGLREGVIYKLTQRQTAFAADKWQSGSKVRTSAVVSGRVISSALRVQL